MWKIIFAILSVATLFISPDCAGGHGVKVTEAWVVEDRVADPNNPEAAPVQAAAIYFKIENTGKDTDHLVAVTTAAAEAAQIMGTMVKDDGLQTAAVAGIDIKPDHTVTLRPGKSFVRLTNLKQPLIEGASVPITLSFQNAGEIKQNVLVEKKGAVRYEN